MRIVQVSTLYPPELFSGGTLAPHQIARGLQRRGHDVSVYSGSCVYGESSLSEKTWVYDGVPVHAINVMSGYAQGVPNYRNASVAERFDRYVAAMRPDIVHFHCVQALGADILSVPRAHGAASVVTMHDGWFVCSRQFMFTGPPLMRMCPLKVDSSRCDCIAGFDFVGRRRFLEASLESVDRVLAVSSGFADVLRENGVAPGKVVVCENGLAPASPLPRTPRTGPLRLGHLAGPDAWKGSGTLARALELVGSGIEVQLHGIDPESWTRAGGRWPDAHVRALPRFSPAQLPAIMAGLDVVLVTSLGMETFSIVTREAMQHGVAVIASRSVGPEGAVRDGENGLLYDRGDAAGLAAAIRRFADDPSFLARASAAATATPVRSIEEQVAQVEEIYGELVRGRPRAAPAATPLPRSVLFIAGMDGAPFRYRAANVVEQLQSLGVRATACLQRDEAALDLAGKSDIVVLNRIPWDKYVERIVKRARAAGALLVFGVDDLIFAPELEITALARLPRDTARMYRSGLRLFRRTFDACDAFLGSTDALAETARATGKPAFVHPNTLAPELVAISEKARRSALAERAAHPTRGVRIAYFSGSYAHDADFEVAAPALARVLAAHPEVGLVAGGHLRLPAVLKPFESRVERLPFVPFRELPSVLARVDVNIAPLETPSVFNDAKSALKWFEAAVVGVPTIAAPTQPFRAAIRHGENGLLAATTEEWEHGLLMLVADASLRGRMAEAARADALRDHGFERGVVSAGAVFRELARLAPGPLRPLPSVPDLEIAAIRAQGIGIGRPALEPQGAIAGPAQLVGGTVTPRLGGRVSANQPVFLPTGALFRVDLEVGTYGKMHGYDLVLRVIDLASGTELGRSTVPAEHACDNSWVAFELDDIPTHDGRELLLVLEAPGARRGRGISVYSAHVGWPSGAGWCGRAIGINLCYRTWLRPAAWRPQKTERERALENRLAVAEERLARVMSPPSALERVLRRTRAWPAIEAMADDTGPSLPHRAVRKVLKRVAAARGEQDVDQLMERVRASVPYRLGRRVYRGLVRR